MSDTPSTLTEIGIWMMVAAMPTALIMWNARDLRTGERTDETFNEARLVHHGWLAQASFIKDRSDIDPRANAFVVGEHLPTFVTL